jgi:hypothetical protein
MTRGPYLRVFAVARGLITPGDAFSNIL